MTEIQNKSTKTNVRYGMLSLVFINVVINYLDRSNLSVAASGLSKELELSSVELGLIFSAFGWSYAALQIPGGLVADRIVPRILYAVCLITWSLATVAHGVCKWVCEFIWFQIGNGGI